MRIKWLVIISVVCIGIIFISFMLTKQAGEIKVGPKQEITASEPAPNYPQPLPLPLPRPVTSITKSSPPAKSAITIVSQPAAVEPEKEIPPANTVSYESLAADYETENNPQSGITTIGKRPGRKETQEMQSRGIVLY